MNSPTKCSFSSESEEKEQSKRATKEKARQTRRAQALRENLRRRKQGQDSCEEGEQQRAVLSNLDVSD